MSGLHSFIMTHQDDGVTYIIVQRTEDYEAYWQGDARMWGCGRTPKDAVMEVERSWKDEIAAELVTRRDYLYLLYHPKQLDQRRRAKR